MRSAEKSGMGDFYFIYLVQLSYFFTLLSFCCRNVNWLRSAALVASAIAIYYSLHVSATPLWTPVLWHSLFFLVNLAQLLASAWRRRAVALTPVESFLHQTALANFPPAEVRSFTRIGRLAQLPVNAQLVQINTKLAELYCVLRGRAGVFVGEQNVAELGPGCFVGEMSLLTKAATRADVFAADSLELVIWPHVEIEKWVGAEASRLGLLQTALGTQVVEQLLRQQTPPEDKAG